MKWMQILFTGLIPSKKEIAGIKAMGGTCVEDPSQATHVLCEQVKWMFHAPLSEFGGAHQNKNQN